MRWWNKNKDNPLIIYPFWFYVLVLLVTLPNIQEMVAARGIGVTLSWYAMMLIAALPGGFILMGTMLIVRLLLSIFFSGVRNKDSIEMAGSLYFMLPFVTSIAFGCWLLFN
ncbi:hypothetical protein [Terasakiella pusilla]|uniref:hypothetical protein n=1 Tax=Terasakiella pusilla TaxID=64973 RepID=UPI003AA8178F